MKKAFSIIVPVLNEAAVINDLLDHLQILTDAGRCEVVVVDGSVAGDTRRAIDDREVVCLAAPCGRGRQMNAGAAVAEGDILIFLHADTRLPVDALRLIDRVMADPACPGGAFSLAIGSRKWIYRLIAVLASWRSRLTRIPYGDQVIFIRRSAFRQLGGYPDIPIMEDVALMRGIKKRGGKISILPQCVVTSSRRWEREGVLYTTLRNWLLITAYCLGMPPERLVRYYKNNGSKE